MTGAEILDWATRLGLVPEREGEFINLANFISEPSAGTVKVFSARFL